MKQTMSSGSTSSKVPIILTVLLIIMLGGLFIKTVSLDNKLDKAVTELNRFRDDEAAQTRMLYNEIDYQKSLLRPVVLVKENLVLFPELKISLPYNDFTKTFQYSVDNQAGVNIGITSTLLNDHEVRQLGCSQLVRVNTKDATPFSPWEESAGSTTLADGRTIYLVSAKAFNNNEASTEECASQVWRHITPSQVVQELKKAQNY